MKCEKCGYEEITVEDKICIRLFGKYGRPYEADGSTSVKELIWWAELHQKPNDMDY